MKIVEDMLAANPAAFNTTGKPGLGDMLYKDINGDGIINENDRTNIGSPMPKFTYGWTNTFRYKNFDLSIFINGTYGNKILNLTKRGLTTMSSARTVRNMIVLSA